MIQWLYRDAMSVNPLPQGGSRPLTETVAEEVRVLMTRRGVVQEDLVDVLHVSQTGVSKRLRGLIAFDANEIGLLAAFFGVKPAQLLGETGMPGPPVPPVPPTDGPHGDGGSALAKLTAARKSRVQGSADVTRAYPEAA